MATTPTNTERAFIDAATRLFAEKGYQGTSITDLARELNLTTASLYYYVDSKQDLLARVLETGMVDFLGRLEAITDGPGTPRERLSLAVDNHLDFVMNNRDVVRIFFSYRSFLTEDRRLHYQGVVARYDSLFTNLLQEAMDAGQLMQADATLLRLSALGMINSIVEWFRPEGRLGPAELKASMSNLIMARLLQVP